MKKSIENRKNQKQTQKDNLDKDIKKQANNNNALKPKWHL